MTSVAQTALDRLNGLSNASVLLVSQSGNVVIQHLAEVPRIPASTLKLLTAWAALKHWGKHYRFTTDFFFDDAGILTVKGFGDPFLVSEELDVIASKIAEKLHSAPKTICLDDSYFGKVQIDGQTHTKNPYDAPAAALAANFNTVVLKQTNMGIQSGEPQTPLTSVAIEVSSILSHSSERISLINRIQGLKHFGEILSLKIQDQLETKFEPTVRIGTASNEARLIYRHLNSHTLQDVVSAMLLFSTNFVANQLHLKLGADIYSAPASMEKSNKALSQMVQSEFHWNGFKMKEGAGLSRENRISAVQLVELLSQFEPYHFLLPEIQPGVFAKTGTLKGVRTLAGYIEQSTGRYRFAVLINSDGYDGLREAVLQDLIRLSKGDQTTPIN